MCVRSVMRVEARVGEVRGSEGVQCSPIMETTEGEIEVAYDVRGGW